MVQSKFACMPSFSTNDVIDVDENRNSFVFKKFINAAVYVEKTIKKMAPDCKNYQKHLADTIRIMKTKRCSCSIDRESCPCHPSIISGEGLESIDSGINMETRDSNLKYLKNSQQKLLPSKVLSSKLTINRNEQPKYIERLYATKSLTLKPNIQEQRREMKDLNINENNSKTTPNLTEISIKLDDENIEDYENQENISSTSSSTLSTSSQVTVKRSDKVFQKDMKLSLSSLTSFTPSENESVRDWLSRKIEEEKKKQFERRSEKKRKEVERQKILEKERENFKMWLENKKKKAEKLKAEQERRQQIEHLKQLEKEKRDLQNQINYQVWLKRKQDENADRKNHEQMKILESKYDKERRVSENQRAFQEWLEFSKSKPKPIPLNKGLDSLRSSLSVTYVNPVPWVPNIDYKPASK